MKAANPGQMTTITAAANVTGKRFVDYTGAHCGAGSKAYGVNDRDTDLGNPAGVWIDGIVLVEAGGNVTAGGPVTSDANGKAIAAQPGDTVNGHATEAGSTGDFVLIQLAQTSAPANTRSVTAAAALAANRFVARDGNYPGIGDKALGVSARAIASGAVGVLGVTGVATVEAGAAISAGAAVTSDATGRAITALPGDTVNGHALAAASTAGDLIAVQLSAQSAPLNVTTVTAAANLAANRFLGFAGNYPSAGAKAFGATTRAIASGATGKLVHKGLVLVEAGAGSLTVGTAITTDNTGKAVAITTTEVICGYVVTASTNTGDLIWIRLS